MLVETRDNHCSGETSVIASRPHTHGTPHPRVRGRGSMTHHPPRISRRPPTSRRSRPRRGAIARAVSASFADMIHELLPPPMEQFIDHLLQVHDLEPVLVDIG